MGNQFNECAHMAQYGLVVRIRSVQETLERLRHVQPEYSDDEFEEALSKWEFVEMTPENC